MTILELIANLENLHAEHGNLDVILTILSMTCANWRLNVKDFMEKTMGGKL